jgi:hypothetical protein
MPERNLDKDLRELLAILSDEAVQTPQEVFRRCEALERMSRSGTTSDQALRSIMQTLLVPVHVDCVLALRVAAAEAVWKVGRRHDLALPFLSWALKDEYWGASRKAVEVLGEMAAVAHEVVPDLASLASRRLERGPFHYEQHGVGSGESLLTVLAHALGTCGLGLAHISTAREALNRFAEAPDADARSAAQHALKRLQTAN